MLLLVGYICFETRNTHSSITESENNGKDLGEERWYKVCSIWSTSTNLITSTETLWLKENKYGVQEDIIRGRTRCVIIIKRWHRFEWKSLPTLSKPTYINREVEQVTYSTFSWKMFWLVITEKKTTVVADNTDGSGPFRFPSKSFQKTELKNVLVYVPWQLFILSCY